MIDAVLNDRYKVIEMIGRGGMAYVYKAVDLKLNREVAVKVLREDYTENEQFIKKFDRESQAAAGLSHPNIVSVYDVGVQDNIYYIIMEYVDGITLKQYLTSKPEGHLGYFEATQFVMEVASALKCAHEHKIIHRDIKPHNILLTKDYTPKVADFGIARAITSSTVTVTNQTMGSVHYISPEQARGGFVDECSDLYSLGIMYYELLTGQLPFDAETSVSIAIKHIQEPINPPKNLNPEIPDSVNEVVLKLTQKKPEDRYQNAQELIDDLDIMLDDFEATLPNNPIQTAPLDSFGTDLFTVEEDSGPIDANEDVEHGRYDLKIWVTVGLILLCLLVGGSLYAANSIFNKQVTVPDVVQIPLAEATDKIETAGLVIEVEREVYDAQVPSGNIISQSPSAGSNAREGSNVKVVVSQGIQTVTVPDVIGSSEESANSLLTSNGFTVEIQREYNNDYESGLVYSTDPGPGTRLAQGQPITIFVSKGEDTVTVPGIIGLSQSDAENRLSSNGLNAGTITQQTSSIYAAGVVVSQSPTEGSTVERGTYVSFIVSSGPPPSSSSGSSSSNSEINGSSGSSGSQSSSGSGTQSNTPSSGGSTNGTGSSNTPSSNSGNSSNNSSSSGSNTDDYEGTEDRNETPGTGNSSSNANTENNRTSGTERTPTTTNGSSIYN